MKGSIDFCIKTLMDLGANDEIISHQVGPRRHKALLRAQAGPGPRILRSKTLSVAGGRPSVGVGTSRENASV